MVNETTRNVTLNWLAEPDLTPLTLDKLPKFFEKHGKTGGIYFWIHQGQREQRIAYIGEAGCFQDRFLGDRGHISNALHGMYSAFECEDDLLTAYAKCGAGNYYNSVFGNSEFSENNKFSWGKLEYFTKVAENAQSYAEIIKAGIDRNVRYLEKMRFVFAKTTFTEIWFPDDPNGKASARKQIEGLFMLRLKERLAENYKKDEYRQSGMNERYYYTPTKRKNFFWGSTTGPAVDVRYRMAHDNESEIDTTVLGELGLEREDWVLKYNGKSVIPG